MTTVAEKLEAEDVNRTQIAEIKELIRHVEIHKGLNQISGDIITAGGGFWGVDDDTLLTELRSRLNKLEQ